MIVVWCGPCNKCHNCTAWNNVHSKLLVQDISSCPCFARCKLHSLTDNFVFFFQVSGDCISVSTFGPATFEGWPLPPSVHCSFSILHCVYFIQFYFVHIVAWNPLVYMSTLLNVWNSNQGILIWGHTWGHIVILRKTAVMACLFHLFPFTFLWKDALKN